MASWTVFEPRATAPGTLAAADGSVFVKDGFSLPAFLFAPLWLLWQRMWLAFLFWLAAEVVLRAVAFALHMGDMWAAGLSLLFAWLFALEAGALRCWTLRRKGWRLAGIACGHDLTEAESRHFEGRMPPPSAPPAPPAASSPAGPTRPDAGHGAVLGLFPEPWGART
ncbi:DUF2628 domain-containing protein [Labrys monachus]|uniref:DUF2628 domain-containing protein n=1 Tax=Labrys monachus TaxID=217067 RepID=A0ABU0FNH0_9HYPH|nr:DUF2628 domain-containing protein [Labrys monachus]MDQ0395639.1 hypothetical protein [Labrys monachus]